MVSFPQVDINTDLSESLCFGCGQKNPIGLKLVFRRDGDQVRADFTAGRQYQGWPGVIHGGIISCMLDEAMSHLAHADGRDCVTAKMEVRFRHPAPVEQPLIITSAMVKNSRRLIQAEAKITLHDGTVLAEGSATQFVIDPGESNNHKKDGSNA